MFYVTQMWPRFIFPWALSLLALVPWYVWMGARIRSLGPVRKWTAITLRCLILLALIGAVAGAELVKRSDKLAVFFLLDRSDSIIEPTRSDAVETVKRLGETFMTDKDEAGVIAFGEEASIELTVAPNLEFDQVRSFVGGEQSDMAAAVRLAMAAFPQGYMRRIVVLSDGNDTLGTALEEAKLAQSRGAALDVIPLMIEGGQEVRLREAAAPSRVNAGEPFQVRVVVTADQDCEGILQLAQRTREGKRMLEPTPVTLRKGDNVFLLPQELPESGFYEYEASIESVADTISGNNQGRAFTVIHGEPKVLYVETAPEHSLYLEPALIKEGLDVQRVDVGSVPGSLAQLQNYDAVILSNLSSTDLSAGQLRALEALVRDLGVGLVMIGGPRSFGAGGFHGTPVEKVLPVSMDIKQRKMMPQGALVLILHTCEIADGNAWAREIGLASLNVLSSHDLMGALAWVGSGEGWVYEVQLVGDKTMMRNALTRANPGDMPRMGPTLEMAYQGLRDVSAAVKRIVVISDGDPAGPSGALIGKIVNAGISVSTICISPHSLSDQSMLKKIAEATGGEYYFVQDPQKLPQIFAKEAAVVKSGLLIEEPFEPVIRHDSELLLGLRETPFPSLEGYVTTTAKDNATIPLVTHKEDPLLAQWRYGLGKAVAFTSDVTTLWATPWIAWDGFNRFWAQTVRWAMRDLSSSSFRVETSIRNGKGYVRIDAVDPAGNFVNFLRPKGAATGPAPGFVRSDIDIMQTGPGLYEGTFPVDDPGVYMINLTYENPDGTEGVIPVGLAMDYSREYEHNTTNLPYLEELAAAGGGRVLGEEDNPFVHDLPLSATITPIWPYLAGFAACLFPIEVFVRRVVVDFTLVFVWILALLRKLPGLKRLLPAPAKRTVRTTGVYGDLPAKEFVYAPAAERAAAFDASGQALASAGAPVSADEPAAMAPDTADAPGSSDYMRQLLAAKERALKERTERKRK